jgi:DMSO/TMAO reductase YedYZ heme-binding membrane subunit
MLVLGVSTYFMDRIPKTAWRAIHATAFGTFALALVHGIWAGSETHILAIQVYYAGTTAVVIGAVFQRMSLAWLASRRDEPVKERSA